MELRFKITAHEFASAAGVLIVLGTLGCFGWVLLRAPDITPEKDRHGWSVAAQEDPDTVAFVSELPAFAVVGADGEVISQDNTKSNVRLWDAALKVRGTHFVNTPQQVGDCVSWAMKHGIEYLICVELTTGPPKEVHEVFAPYIYGISRVQIGRGQLRGDGSCVAWAVRGIAQFGVLRVDEVGVPPYSGQLARQWGSQGPPQTLIAKASQFLVRSSSPVRSAKDVRDAICNGYPVPFGAGNIGWERTIERDGRLVGIRSGSWSHAQCVIGYDGSGRQPYYCVVNSWGPLAGGRQPIDGSPPGSYWITEQDMEFVARQGDAFAISNFDGFKARAIDFRLTHRQRGEDHAKHLVLAF